jgi:uncharacterized protein YyaL (SSP411 family)
MFLANSIIERTLRRIEGRRFYNIMSKIPLLTDRKSAFIDLAIGWLCSAQFKKGYLKGFFPRGQTFIKKDEAYPEITGYAATSFSKLYLRTENKYYLYKAITASDALLQFIQSNGAIPGIIYRDGTFEDLVYSFDQGMMARGLLDTYEACIASGKGNFEKYKNGGVRAVDFLLRIQDKNGNLPAECRLDGTGTTEFNYCIMGKVIIPLILTFELTKNDKYLIAAKAIGNYIVDTFQDKNGSFSLIRYIKYQNRVHYHCYAIEGLVELYNKIKDDKYYDSIKKGADFLLGIQQENGSFFYELPGDEQVRWEDPPSVAQAIRIWLSLYEMTQERSYLGASKKAIEYLKIIQYRVRIAKLYGGLPPVVPYPKVTSCTWVVEFAIDAFYQYQKITGGNL